MLLRPFHRKRVCLINSLLTFHHEACSYLPVLIVKVMLLCNIKVSMCLHRELDLEIGHLLRIGR